MGITIGNNAGTPIPTEKLANLVALSKSGPKPKSIAVTEAPTAPTKVEQAAKADTNSITQLIEGGQANAVKIESQAVAEQVTKVAVSNMQAQVSAASFTAHSKLNAKSALAVLES